MEREERNEGKEEQGKEKRSKKEEETAGRNPSQQNQLFHHVQNREGLKEEEEEEETREAKEAKEVKEAKEAKEAARKEKKEKKEKKNKEEEKEEENPLFRERSHTTSTDANPPSFVKYTFLFFLSSSLSFFPSFPPFLLSFPLLFSLSISNLFCLSLRDSESLGNSFLEGLDRKPSGSFSIFSPISFK